MKYNKIFLILFIFLFFIFSCKSNNQTIEENPSIQEEEIVLETNDFFGESNLLPIQETININFGDFDGMQDFAKKCQNGQFTEGQTVVIDGELSISFSASIGGRRDNEYLGTTLQVEGWTNDNFPEDGCRVKVSATIARNKDYYFEYLIANPEDITVIEE